MHHSAIHYRPTDQRGTSSSTTVGFHERGSLVFANNNSEYHYSHQAALLQACTNGAPQILRNIITLMVFPLRQFVKFHRTSIQVWRRLKPQYPPHGCNIKRDDLCSRFILAADAIFDPFVWSHAGAHSADDSPENSLFYSGPLRER